MNWYCINESDTGDWPTSIWDGLGIPKSQIPPTGTSGGGYLLNDAAASAESDEFSSVILTVPPVGTFTHNEYSALSFTSAPDGVHVATYSAKRNGVPYLNPETGGGEWLITMTIGSVAIPPVGTTTITSVNKTTTTASVNYSYSDADQTGFDCRLGGVTLIEDVANPAVLSSLTPSTAYSVEVRAKNASGPGAWSAPVSFTTDAVPIVAPAGVVTITSVTPYATSAVVNFNYSEADATSYSYRLNGGAAVAVTSSPAVIIGLTAETAYTVQIRAENSAGSSSWSTVANFTTTQESAATSDTMISALLKPLLKPLIKPLRK